MKSLFTAASFLLTVSAFAASSPSMFVGRYKTLSTANCDRDGGSRAYVTVSKYAGLDALNIQYYSEEAVIVEIPTVGGKVSSPGSTGFTDTIKASWANPTTLNVSAITDGASSGQRVHYVTEYKVEKLGKKLIVTTSTDGRVDSACEMVQY